MALTVEPRKRKASMPTAAEMHTREATSAHTDAARGVQRTVLVLYGTDTGTAAELSESLARTIRSAVRRASSLGTSAAGGANVNVNVTVAAMDDYLRKTTVSTPQSSTGTLTLRDDLLPDVDMAIFLCSTVGQGDPPANMRRFWRSLLFRTLGPDSLGPSAAYPRLNSPLKFAVFGLGDSSYRCFNFPSKKLFKRLLQLGGTPVLPRGEGDDQHYMGTDGAFIPFVEQIVPETLKAVGISPVKSEVQDRGKSNLECPYLLPVLMDDVLAEVDLQCESSMVMTDEARAKITKLARSLFVRPQDNINGHHDEEVDTFMDKVYGTGHMFSEGQVKVNESLTSGQGPSNVRRLVIEASQNPRFTSNFERNVQQSIELISNSVDKNSLLDQKLQSFKRLLDHCETKNETSTLEPGDIIQVKPKNSNLAATDKILSHFGMKDISEIPLTIVPTALLPKEIFQKIDDAKHIRSKEHSLFDHTETVNQWYKETLTYLVEQIIVHSSTLDSQCKCKFCEINVGPSLKSDLGRLVYPEYMSPPEEFQPLIQTRQPGSAKTLTYRDLFIDHLDFLGKPRRYSFDELLNLLKNFHDGSQDVPTHFVGKLIRFSTAQGIDEFFDYAVRPKRNLFDVLIDFDRIARDPKSKSNCCSAIRYYLLDLIPMVKPRDYSISGATGLGDETFDTTDPGVIDKTLNVEIALSVDSYKTSLMVLAEDPTNEESKIVKSSDTPFKPLDIKSRLGLCSSYMTDLKVGESIRYKLKPGTLKLIRQENKANKLIITKLWESIGEYCKNKYETSEIQGYELLRLLSDMYDSFPTLKNSITQPIYLTILPNVLISNLQFKNSIFPVMSYKKHGPTHLLTISTGTGVAPIKSIIERRRTQYRNIRKMDKIDQGISTISILGNRNLGDDFLFNEYFINTSSSKYCYGGSEEVQEWEKRILEANDKKKIPLSSPSFIANRLDFAPETGVLIKEDGVLYIPKLSQLSPRFQFKLGKNYKGYVQDIINSKSQWDVAEFILFGDPVNSIGWIPSATGRGPTAESKTCTLYEKLFYIISEADKGDLSIPPNRDSFEKSYYDLLKAKILAGESRPVKDIINSYIGKMYTSTRIVIGGSKSSGMPKSVKISIEKCISLWIQWVIKALAKSIIMRDIENILSKTEFVDGQVLTASDLLNVAARIDNKEFVSVMEASVTPIISGICPPLNQSTPATNQRIHNLITRIVKYSQNFILFFGTRLVTDISVQMRNGSVGSLLRANGSDSKELTVLIREYYNTALDKSFDLYTPGPLGKDAIIDGDKSLPGVIEIIDKESDITLELSKLIIADYVAKNYIQEECWG